MLFQGNLGKENNPIGRVMYGGKRYSQRCRWIRLFLFVFVVE